MAEKINTRVEILYLIVKLIVPFQGDRVNHFSTFRNNDVLLFRIDYFTTNPSTSAIIIFRLIAGKTQYSRYEKEEYVFNRMQNFLDS